MVVLPAAVPNTLGKEVTKVQEVISKFAWQGGSLCLVQVRHPASDIVRIITVTQKPTTKANTDV